MRCPPRIRPVRLRRFRAGAPSPASVLAKPAGGHGRGSTSIYDGARTQLHVGVTAPCICTGRADDRKGDERVSDGAETQSSSVSASGLPPFLCKSNPGTHPAVINVNESVL